MLNGTLNRERYQGTGGNAYAYLTDAGKFAQRNNTKPKVVRHTNVSSVKRVLCLI